jgi:hypothetical protein
MNKVIDLFHYSGETELLKLKIEKTSSFVNEYWISNFSSEESLLSDLSEVQISKDIKIKLLDNIDLLVHSELLVEEFVKDRISFESVLIFSKIDEIYHIDNIENYLPFGFHILEITESNSNKFLGPVICYRTTYCYEKLKFENVIKQKLGKIRLKENYVIKDSGYKIAQDNNPSNFYFILD